MKFLIVVAALILAINASNVEELWKKFKEHNGRQYRNIREEQERFAIFQRNLQKIEEHNEKYNRGEKSYYLGLNSFGDMSESEFRALLNTSRSNMPVLNPAYTTKYKPTGVQLPSEVNWVKKGVVTGVKNQGSCGSCWSFSVTGTLEGQYAIKHGKLISLSEQDLMDCSNRYGTAGCNGGYMELAYDYVKDNGIDRESDYPYTAREGKCVHDSSKSVLKVSGYVWVSNNGNEKALAEAVAKVGPISISIEADHFQFYSGGIFDEKSCTTNVDHGVLAVGYGTENGVEYWLVKNSWGTDWGEHGYLRMSRNKKNQCGIASYATYAVVN